MKTITSRGTTWLPVLFKIQSFVIMVIIFTGCASTGEGETEAANGDAAAGGTETAAVASEAANGASATTDATVVAFVPPDADGASLPDITKPPSIVEECKNEPYVKQEEQARQSIKKGKEATVAEVYGVGFRNAAEHKKWSNMHNQLFAGVSQACAELSKCAKLYKEKKQKTKNCASQAKMYDEWKQTVKDFTDKIKTVETTQPPKLCSSPPSLDDQPDCFEKLAARVEKACDSDACKEVSQCWRSIKFLDLAINQAESACKFARQKLSECRGYSTATARRKAKFSQCSDLQQQSGIKIVPVL
jgi:hypothetical protein